MNIDPNRSTFVQQEYRYEIAQNLSIKAVYPSARELVHNTNLSDVDSSNLAANLFNENNKVTQAYDVEVEGIYDLDDFEGGPLRWVLNFPQFATDGRAFKTAAIRLDPIRNRTILTVRG